MTKLQRSYNTSGLERFRFSNPRYHCATARCDRGHCARGQSVANAQQRILCPRNSSKNLGRAAGSGGVAGIGREAGRFDAVNGAASSCSETSPLMPTAPMMPPSPPRMSAPPGAGIDAALGGVGQRRDEGRAPQPGGRTRGRRNPHTQAAPGFALRDLRPHDAGTVLAPLKARRCPPASSTATASGLPASRCRPCSSALSDDKRGLREGEGRHGRSLPVGSMRKRQRGRAAALQRGDLSGRRPQRASEAMPRSPGTSRRRRRPAGVRLKRGAGAGCMTPSTSTKVLARAEVRMLRRLGQRQHRREAGVAAFEQLRTIRRASCVLNARRALALSCRPARRDRAGRQRLAGRVPAAAAAARRTCLDRRRPTTYLPSAVS